MEQLLLKERDRGVNLSTSQGFDMDLQQAGALHQPIQSTGHLGIIYAIEASEPVKMHKRFTQFVFLT